MYLRCYFIYRELHWIPLGVLWCLGMLCKDRMAIGFHMEGISGGVSNLILTQGILNYSKFSKSLAIWSSTSSFLSFSGLQLKQKQRNVSLCVIFLYHATTYKHLLQEYMGHMAAWHIISSVLGIWPLWQH